MGHTSFQLNRRQFLRRGITTAGALAISPAFLERAFAAPITVGSGPYGPISTAYDANGIALPQGFTSREIARGGANVAGATPPYAWHFATDGQATFPTITGGTPDGGWILVANSEMPAPGAGGVSAVEFSGVDGTGASVVERAGRILTGTTSNCAGGPTPWGTWLSCEEYWGGRVHECDPAALAPGTPATTARPALGVFAHEAVCVDPVNEQLYLTEDEGDGCLYRFTPDDYPNLSAGLLEVAVGTAPGVVTWAEVPDPSAGGQGFGDAMMNPTREQVPGAARFDGGEGTWYDEGVVYFTTKGDNRVWTYTVATSSLEVLYDASEVGPDPPLTGVDNITVAPSGDIYVCEDPGNPDVCVITPGFEASVFLRLDPVKHSGPPDENPVGGNETVGVVFSPDGTKMYFGAQRTTFDPLGQAPVGVVYEVSGPFRQTIPLPDPDPSDNGKGRKKGHDKNKKAGTSRASGAKLTARTRRSVPKLLRSGLPITLDLDEPAGVDATLKISVPGEGRRRSLLIARARPSVAVSGKVALKLEPTRRAAQRLSGGEEFMAGLRVVVTDAAGNKTVLRRKVVLESNKNK